MLLAFDDVGPGPVVVLLHGFPLDRSMWSNQRSSIGSIYRLILPDLRGHGSSAAPDGIYTVDEMADDVLELLGALQLTEPVIIGGLSMGGYVALSIAARHPERVKALLLLNTKASADTAQTASNRLGMAEQIEASGRTDEVVGAMIPRLFAPETFNSHPDLVAKVRHQMLKTPARAVAGTLRGLAARPDRMGDLAKIRVPTLIIAGSEDLVISRADSEAMAWAIPGAQLVTIPNAGHLTPLENPRSTDATILSFLESLW